MAGVDQEFRLTEVTLTESIEALLPKSGRDTNPRPFFENSLDKVLDLDVIENDEPTELSLLSDATEDSLKLGFFFSYLCNMLRNLKGNIDLIF